MICFPFAISLRPAILCGGKRPEEDIYRNARLFASVFPDSDPPVPIVCMLNYFRMYRIRKYFHQVCWGPNKFVTLSLLPRWAYPSPGKNKLLDFSTESRFLKFLSRIKYSPMTAPAGEELCNSTQVFSPMNCSKISRLRVLVQLRRYSQSFSKLQVLPKTEAILEFFKVWFVDRAYRSKKG